MVLAQSAGTHSSKLTSPLQQSTAFGKNTQFLLALSDLFPEKLFMYGEDRGHLDQPSLSKLDHQFAL